MIWKHVDLFAIGFLVAGMAIVGEASRWEAIQAKTGSSLVKVTARRVESAISRARLSRFCLTLD